MSEDLTAEFDQIVKGQTDGDDLAFNPEPVAPADQQVEGSQDDPSGGKPEPGAKAPESEHAAQRIEELTRRLREIEEDPDVLEARAKRLRRQLGEPEAQPVPHQPEPQPVQRPEDVAAAEQALIQELTKAPVKTIVGIAAEVAKRIVEQQTGPLAQSVFTTTLNQYRAARSQYPLFRSIAPIFEELVAKIDRKAVANQSAEQIWALLQATEDLALGRGARLTYEKSLAPTLGAPAPAREPAPQMGVSGAAGAVGGPRKYNIPRDVIVLGRAAGLSDKEILEDWLAQQAEEA